ncbi:SAM-dependent methyltransferase [Gordonia sp. HY442]|uniref:N5-glutamine methyltransferase family protein n=1 Tax=Gordonia zhenghanii TaxID=2911516 RepID=UPI001F389849|nr:SAM-dependent methyltransferase [Gordonia zhenghanii]MCF8607732.1 SAM-dependent methyltransferase [Gordonia zhenghanii]
MFADDEARVLRRWAADDRQVDDWVRRRAVGEPLEHIVGRVEFGGLDLYVGPGVFVPRRRSLLLAEVVVERAVVDQVAERDAIVVEACCGVAPIAAVVRDRAPRTPVMLADVEGRALAFARRNVPGVDVYEGELLAALPPRARGRVAVIAAVPPYVPDSQARLLPAEATDHEPRRALFGGPDGLDTVRLLLEQSLVYLVRGDERMRGGVVALEMHRSQAGTAQEIAASHGYRTRIVVGDDGQTVVLLASVV